MSKFVEITENYCPNCDSTLTQDWSILPRHLIGTLHFYGTKTENINRWYCTKCNRVYKKED